MIKIKTPNINNLSDDHNVKMPLYSQRHFTFGAQGHSIQVLLTSGLRSQKSKSDVSTRRHTQ